MMLSLMTIGRVRTLQLLGLLLALAGLIGYWMTGGVTRTVLTKEQKELLKITDGFHASFVVAGKDIHYDPGESTPVYDDQGQIVAWNYSGTRTSDGTNTDTILYVQMIGNDMTVVALPRDLYLSGWKTRVNAMYAYQGAEGLKKSVEEIIGLPIDYYAIIDTDIFKDFVNALDGVEVNIQNPMHYDDNAGDLHIHFDPGLQTLDGQDVIEFVRFRHTARGDRDRLDNVKTLSYAMLARLKELNLGTALKLPELISAFFDNVETNVDPALAQQLLRRLQSLTLKQMATLPGEDGRVAGIGAVVTYDRERVEGFLAKTFGGEAREFIKAPQLTLLITNRSSVEGLEEDYKARLISMGLSEEQIVTRQGEPEPTLTRILATENHWQDAEYFTSLLQTGRQQIDSLPDFKRSSIDLELVLGQDVITTGLMPQDSEIRTER
jgi:polyisoprenyl-teichoic acid--peptidoglycan teichoic acid transferase